jgi:hypothetical protein
MIRCGEKQRQKRVKQMGGIIFQIVVIVGLIGLLLYVARDDRRNRALRLMEEEAEEEERARGNGRDSMD